MLRPGGLLTLIHRADRLAEVLAALARPPATSWSSRSGRAPATGPPSASWCRAARAPRRRCALAPGLVLHEPDGRLTAAADAILRHGEALPLDARTVGTADG